MWVLHRKTCGKSVKKDSLLEFFPSKGYNKLNRFVMPVVLQKNGVTYDTFFS